MQQACSASQRGAACSALKWEGPLNHFKERLASGVDVFGDLMDKYLLNNQHRVTVVTLPDSQLGAQIEAKEQQRIESARSQMTAEDVRPLQQNTVGPLNIVVGCSGIVFSASRYRCKNCLLYTSPSPRD